MFQFNNLRTYNFFMKYALPLISLLGCNHVYGSVDGLVLHLDASQGIELDNQQNVTAWNDISDQGLRLEALGNPRRTSENGGAIEFDGVDDALVSALSNQLPLGSSDRTVIMLVSYSSVGSGGFGYGQSRHNNAFGLSVESEGKLRVNSYGSWYDAVTSSTATNGGWLIHSAILRNGVLSQYRDNVLIDSVSRQPNTTNGSIVIGADLDRNPYVAMKLASLQVYDRALSADEMKTLHDSLSSGTNGSRGNRVQIAQPSPVIVPEIVATPNNIGPDAPEVPGAPENVPSVGGSRTSGNMTWSNGDEWPDVDDKLPLGGLMYGMSQWGLRTGNAQLAEDSSRQFRAERTGWIDAVTFPVRTLTDANVRGRCTTADPDSVWCTCVRNNLDRFSCGYTLSNSYSVGNGGILRAQIRSSNEDGSPSETVLGEAAEEIIPSQQPGNNIRPEIPLKEPVYLQAGKTYHLSVINRAPPVNCKIARVNPADARFCDRNRGAMGLNGIHLADAKGVAGFDPFRGTSAGNWVRFGKNNRWQRDEDNLSFYEVRYDDGQWVGESYAGYGGTTSSEGRREIGGSTVARQAFTVQEETRTVNGVWIMFGHRDNGNVDGSPLSLVLRDEAGNSLATGSIEYSEECATLAESGNRLRVWTDQHCRAWGYSDFSNTVSLENGETYGLEISASTSGGFLLTTFFPLDYGIYVSDSRNQWDEAQAEISTDGGCHLEELAGTSLS